jgi:hypothetical protein
MKQRRKITADEMVGEFLKAELHSSRFRAGSLKALTMLGYDDSLLENPDYDNTDQNEKRAKVLGLCRGWPDTELFSNFPGDTQWFAVDLPLEELKKTYRLKSSPSMTNSERLLATTAARVMRGETVKNIDNKLIGEIRAKIEQQQVLPPIILVSSSLDGQKRVLIEGHSRSVSYACCNQLPNDIPAIIGISDSMDSWAYF